MSARLIDALACDDLDDMSQTLTLVRRAYSRSAIIAQWKKLCVDVNSASFRRAEHLGSKARVVKNLKAMQRLLLKPDAYAGRGGRKFLAKDFAKTATRKATPRRARSNGEIDWYVSFAEFKGAEFEASYKVKAPTVDEAVKAAFARLVGDRYDPRPYVDSIGYLTYLQVQPVVQPATGFVRHGLEVEYSGRKSLKMRIVGPWRTRSLPQW